MPPRQMRVSRSAEGEWERDRERETMIALPRVASSGRSPPTRHNATTTTQQIGKL